MNPTSSYLMRTEKLYESSELGYVYEFDAAVLDCIPDDNGFLVELDRTAFFPEGGGQSADEGTLGGLAVRDVQIKDGRIFHLTDSPLNAGDTVHGSIDKGLRFSRMQNHSGEHVVSGLIHSLYGFENVGFHMSKSEMTIDTDSPLTDEMILKIEREANRTVWENREIKCFYPAEDILKQMEYRSKTELSGDVRIVEIDGIDRCACCAPHVRRTGEIGSIHIKEHIKYKKGTRLTVVCGEWAMEDHISLKEIAEKLGRALSSPADGLYDAYMKKEAILSNKLGELRALKEKLLSIRLASLSQTDGNICVFEDGCDAGLLRKLVNDGVSLTNGLFAAFSKKEDGLGYAYVIGAKHGDLAPLAKEISASLGGRGGGKGPMITGFVESDEKMIREFFESK
jgi:alanyl-tRNA synthetase